MASQYLLLDQKECCQHDQCHVMMPCVPSAHLIIGHAAFTFCFMKVVFDEETLRLYLCQLL